MKKKPKSYSSHAKQQDLWLLLVSQAVVCLLVHIFCTVWSLTGVGVSCTGVKPAINLHSRHKALKCFLKNRFLTWRGHHGIQSKL